MNPTRSWPTRLLTLTATTAVALAAVGVVSTPAIAAGAPYRAKAVPITAPTTDHNTTVIPNAYLVTFREGADPAVALRALKAPARINFGKGINGFATDLSPSQVAELSHSSDVVRIEQDAWHHNVLDTTQTNPPAWGIDRIDQAALPLSKSYTYTATGAAL